MQTHLRSLIISLTSVVAAGITVAVPAQAASLTWTLQNAVFDDGGTMTGSFDYDAETYTYSNVNIAVSSGTVLDDFVYQTSSLCTIGFIGTCINSVLSPQSNQVEFYNLSGIYQRDSLFIEFTQKLTNAGGVVPLDNTGELRYMPAKGDNPTLGLRVLVSGEVVAQLPAAPVPEPTTVVGLALVGSGLAAMRRRKATMQAPQLEPDSAS